MIDQDLKIECMLALSGEQPMKFTRAKEFLDLIDEMGRSDLAAARSAAAILIGHMLKWYTTVCYRIQSGRDSIIQKRVELYLLLDTIPSLENQLKDTWNKTYEKGIKFAMDDTGLPRNAFPADPQWATAEELLADAETMFSK